MDYIREKKLKSGTRFKAEVRLKGHPEVTAVFDRKTDAKNWISQVEADIRADRNNLYTDSKRRTLAEAIERFAKEKEVSVVKRGHLAWWNKELGSFYLVGVDVGFTNPTGFTMIGFNDEASPHLWVEKEYYWDSKKMGRQKTDAEYAEDLSKFIEGYPVKFVYIDPAAASFKIEARRCGLNVTVKDAENNVLEGIKTLSSMLSMGDLKVLRSCRNLIGEIQGYTWDSKATERGEDAPIKRADHLLDSLRYGIFSYFGDKVSLKEPTQKSLEGRTLGSQQSSEHSSGLSRMTDYRELTQRNFADQFKQKTF